MNHWHRMFSGCRKTGVELSGCIAKSAKQLASITGCRTQTPHQSLECLAFDIFHDHAKLVAHAAAIDNPGQVLIASSGALGRKQTLIYPANLDRRVDTLANKRPKRPATGALKVHELSRLNIRTLEYTVYAIAIIALE